ncbi:MAG: alpha/beta hydrolase [Mycobacterium sp.]|nr:alpha/beta hydrolase [Mycobacterium sp.]
MTSTPPRPRRSRVGDRLAGLPGVRAVRRPVTPNAADRFDLYYVRTGPKSDHPLLVVPGGPGMASIGSYQGLRRRAAAAGLDVIMVEHRGVGLSRCDESGADLPPDALTIEQVVDDMTAVLDDAQVDRAVVYGTSYGTYLAAGLGVRHPCRVEAMILDSPLLNRHDIEAVRQALRELLWHGPELEVAAPDAAEPEEPQSPALGAQVPDLAAKVRRLVDVDAMTPVDAQIAAVVYGLGGEELLHRHLDLLLGGRRLLWTALLEVSRRVARRKLPYRNETDLVGPIGFRELNFAGEPDGLPLDPAVAWRELMGDDTSFAGEPFDLVAKMPTFDWHTVVISGGRDLVTPPTVADRIAELIPSSALVRLATAGHSVLDTRERAALHIAREVCAGRTETLAGQGEALDSLPASPAVRLAGSALDAAARIEAALPKLPGRPTS